MTDAEPYDKNKTGFACFCGDHVALSFNLYVRGILIGTLIKLCGHYALIYVA